MSEGADIRDTGRSQSTMCLQKKGFCFKSKTECVIEELSMCCCCNEDGQTKSHVKELRDDCVQRSEERD